MAPRRRKEGEPPPDYGLDSLKFSVEVHHGGVFCGIGADCAYVGGKCDWFDNVDADSWSYYWIEEFVMMLDYGFSPRNLKVCWLLPDKELSDGLRIIESDQDTQAMRAIVDKVKTFVLFFDHDWHEEPKVDVEPEEIDDPEFMDSDNDIQDGDDDLFVDHLDEDVTEQSLAKKSKKAAGSRLGKAAATVRQSLNVQDIDSDDEGLDLPEDSNGEGGVQLKFKSFMPDDLNNPTFTIGMCFPSVEMVRKAVTEYSLRHRVDIKMPRNEKTRIGAHCALGCPWKLYASKDSRSQTIMVKSYV
ncbi:unnamed protein product [Urochloa humidicola]